jgi:hypothetical protein
VNLAPRRIQRPPRVPGWQLPPGAVYVGRPSKWGNPFHWGAIGDLLGRCVSRREAQEIAVEMFDMWISDPWNGDGELVHEAQQYRAELPLLADKDLVCWCTLEDEEGQRYPCHADVMLRHLGDTA